MKRELPLDFVLSFCREMVPGQGEDCSCGAFCDDAGLLAVFDGCGGAGARTHDYYSGHTEAYMASRLCAGVFYDQFCAMFPCGLSGQSMAQEVFAPAAVCRLKRYAPPADPDGITVKGSMIRTLPTTAAAALVRCSSPEELEVSAIWAGDSRVYVLNEEGLAQLTVDDTSVPDPMETLYEDGVLRNILCSDRKVTLNCRTVTLKPPFVLFSATDGCFGYLSTPMEFEGLLLQTLMEAQTPAQWEEALCGALGAQAGDDYTLRLAALGYGTFEALQDSLRPRWQWLQEQFLNQIWQLPLEDLETRCALWAHYRGSYLRYIKDVQANG